MSEFINDSLTEAQRRMVLGEARFLLVPFAWENGCFRYDTRGLVALSSIRDRDELAQAMSALEKLPRLLEEFFLEEGLVDFSPERLYFSALNKEIHIMLAERKADNPSAVTVLSRWLTVRFEEELLKEHADEKYLFELVYLLRAFLKADDVEQGAALYLTETAARRLAEEELEESPSEPVRGKSSLLKNVFDGIMNHKAFS